MVEVDQTVRVKKEHHYQGVNDKGKQTHPHHEPIHGGCSVDKLEAIGQVRQHQATCQRQSERKTKTDRTVKCIH